MQMYGTSGCDVFFLCYDDTSVVMGYVMQAEKDFYLVQAGLQVAGVLELGLQLLNAPLEAAHLLLQDAQLPAQLQPRLHLSCQLRLVAAQQSTCN